MEKFRAFFFAFARQRYPSLQTMNVMKMPTFICACAFGVGYALPGGHPVYGTRRDHLMRTQGIAVGDFAVEKIGDGGQTDMRVRANIQTFADAIFRRTHMVEEDKGAEHPALGPWQQAPDGQAANIGFTGGDGQFDQGLRVWHVFYCGLRCFWGKYSAMNDKLYDEMMQNIEITLAHHEQQIADMSEMLNAQWQQIEVLKRQLAMAQDKLKGLEAGAADASADANLSVTEIAARDKPPHY